MKEEQNKIDEENKKITKQNNMEFVIDMKKIISKNKTDNKKNTVFKSNVKVISESVILERRKEKKRIRAIEKKAEKIQEEINSKKMKEEMELEREQKKKEKDLYREELINSIKEDKLSDNKKNMINDLEIVIKKLDAVKEIEVALAIEDKKEQKIIKKTVNKEVEGWSITMSRGSGDKKERVKFLCESIISKTKCRHGDKCNFSHVISACPFGVKCLNVEKKESASGGANTYINKGRKICTFTHLNETIEDFEIRVGINKQNKKSEVIDFMEAGRRAVEEPKEIKKELDFLGSAVGKCIVYGRTIDSNNTWSNIASIGITPREVISGKGFIDFGEAGRRAVDVVSEKKKSVITLNKTQMCNSVSSNIKCRHGDKCRYAHSKEELVCGYGDSCKSKNCDRLHSSPISKAVDASEGGASAKGGDLRKASSANVNEFNTNSKVKLCAFIGRCKNGINCKYSHIVSTSEKLVYTTSTFECGYGNQCKKVCWDGYKYINIHNTICDRRHPYEDNILYKYRCSK